MAVTRSLSSPSQVLKREARRAQRAGFRETAEKLYEEGVATSLEEKEARGSNIRSYEEENKSRAYRERAKDLSNAQRAALLRGENPLDTAATSQQPTRSTNASLNEARPGETATQFYARQRESRMGTPKPSTASTSTSIRQPVPISTPQPALTNPPQLAPASIRRPDLPSTPQPAPATKPAASIDYLDTSGSPMVEQTRAEKDMVRREALQSAYDKLTNPTGAAGSMAEVGAQQAKASAAPAAPTTPAGPTMSELVSGLRESFDRSDRAKRKAEIAARPVVIGGVTMPAGYGVPATQAQKDFDAEQQRIARIMDQGPRTPVEDYVEPTPPPVQPKTSPGAARFTGRLLRKVGQLSDAAKVGTSMAVDKAGKLATSDPFVNPSPAMMAEADRRKTLQQTLAPAARALKEARREFSRGLQGQ